MKLSNLPKEILVAVIEKNFDERHVNSLHIECSREILFRELDRLKEEVEKASGNSEAQERIKFCINDVHNELAKLRRSHDAFIK
jgi:glutamine synthetase type III